MSTLTDLKLQVLARETSASGSLADIERVFYQTSLDSGGTVPLLESNDSVRIDIDNNNDSTTDVFSITKDNNASELFRVQENGNVGIGTNLPDAILDVKSTVGTIANFKRSGTTRVGLSASSNNGAVTITGSGSNQFTLGTAISDFEIWDGVSLGSGDLRFKIDGTTGSVGMGTASPDADAILDLASTTKAFLPPRMTTTQRDAIPTPTAGMVIYNSTTNVLDFFNGTVWGAV